MNALKFITIVVAAAITMAACNSDDDVITGDDGRVEVKFSANTAEIQTRVTDKSWAANDPVGIYMIGKDAGLTTDNIKESAGNREYRAAAGTGAVAFTAAGGKIYYPMSGNVEFIAYHPYKASLSSFNLPIDVATANQSNQSKIDVLYAPKTSGSYNKSTTSPVALAFQHKLVKLVFTIGKEASVTEALAGLTVKITGQQTAATLNLTSGTVTPSGGTSEITANTIANGTSSEAIVLPNSGVGSMKFTFTTTGAGAGTYEVEVPPPTNSKWESGKKYTYIVTLKRNEVGITGSVGNWTAGNTHNIDGVPQ
jgi:hypothetical protein